MQRLKFGAIVLWIFILNGCSKSQISRNPQSEEDICSKRIPNSGCIIINENSHSLADGKIKIRYQWLSPFDSKKQTFIFLNGGPGGGFGYYMAFQDFWRATHLGRHFNVLFFDPRGVGGSSPVDATNVSSRNMKNYTFSGMVEDIEGLRSQLLGDKKVGLIGHSTGGHLVFSYALKYPANVFKIISLHGAVSEIGFLTQYHDRITEWMNATVGIEQKKIELLKKKIEDGQACLDDGNKIPPRAWSQLVNYALYGTYSQRESLHPTLVSLIKGNVDGTSHCSQTPKGPSASDLVEGPAPQDPLNAMGGINLIINSNVTCSNLLTYDEVEALSPPYLEGARELWKRDCSNLVSSGKILEDPFDVRKDVKSLSIPILLLGADHDQWIAPRAQQEAWDTLLDNQKKTSKFVLLNKCSHFSFYDCPGQLKAALDDFMR